MRLRLMVLAALAAAGVGAFPAAAADCAGLPKHTAFPVVDAANAIPPQPEAYLIADLMRHHIDGNEAIVAVTVPTLGGDDVASYAHRLFDCWGIGDADSDNGVLILVAMKEHRVRIELGAGLEGDVSQEDLDRALATMVAPMRAGNVAGGLRAAASSVAEDLGGSLPDTEAFAKGRGGAIPTAEPGSDVVDVPDGTFPRGLPNDSSPYGVRDHSGRGIVAAIPVFIVLAVVWTVVRAVFRGGRGGGVSTWRGGFPGYGPGAWGSPSVFNNGGWSGWGSHSGGSSFGGSSFGGSSGSSGSSGGSSGGGSFGGGSSGGGGASGSW